MNKKKKPSLKALVSVAEFERKYLPNSFEKRIKEQQEKKAGAFGEEHTSEFLKDIKRRLSEK